MNSCRECGFYCVSHRPPEATSGVSLRSTSVRKRTPCGPTCTRLVIALISSRVILASYTPLAGVRAGSLPSDSEAFAARMAHFVHSLAHRVGAARGSMGHPPRRFA
jgi:hypothetical protein